jgi:hypothetical protein
LTRPAITAETEARSLLKPDMDPQVCREGGCPLKHGDAIERIAIVVEYFLQNAVDDARSWLAS